MYFDGHIADLRQEPFYKRLVEWKRLRFFVEEKQLVAADRIAAVRLHDSTRLSSFIIGSTPFMSSAYMKRGPMPGEWILILQCRLDMHYNKM